MMELQNAINQYLRMIQYSKKQGTYEMYKSHLEYIQKQLPKNIEDINHDVLYQFVDNQKRQKVTNKTINHRIGVLRRTILYVSPGHNIEKFPRLKQKNKNFSDIPLKTIDRVTKYLLRQDNNSLYHLRNKVIWLLFVDTGIRLNELLQLDVENINTNERFILLTETKNNKERLVFFTTRTNYYIKQYIFKLNYLQGPLLVNTNNRKRITKSAIQILFRKIRQALNIEKMSPHMVRHTYATTLLKNGASMEFVRKTMGHSNLSVTQLYLHLDIETMLNEYNTLINK